MGVRQRGVYRLIAPDGLSRGGGGAPLMFQLPKCPCFQYLKPHAPSSSSTKTSELLCLDGFLPAHSSAKTKECLSLCCRAAGVCSER